ncbi:MAG: hypothetical protein A2X94_11670 [Bdellovibrionales bacterium GWB1_55_8]|nr:MAG: hypothetical protein A2X94_11670 [Bdellovibrionales bacterium GWB1_55_8]
MKRRSFLNLGILATLLVAAPAFAAPEAPGRPATSLAGLLLRQSALIKTVTPYVEREDLPRLLALKQLATRAHDVMRTYGSANMLTMQRLQELVIGFRFSKDLFRQISTAKTAQQLIEIQTISQQITDMTGFDKSPYTQITASVFGQIHKLTRDLMDLPLPDSLASRFHALTPKLGRLLALAGQGDHPQTFRLATELLGSLRALYPEFDQIMAGQAAFHIVLEIQGLTEYYAEFARSDMGDAP